MNMLSSSTSSNSLEGTSGVSPLIKLEAARPTATVVGVDGAPPSASASAATRPYYGKCQYKTGKCFNERTLKRNGEVHSLCEEHRIKQNLIQRRSDRKYQTVHAIRRRERSQRRAVLKKQVSMAVAQQLYYEHQQQKSLGLPLGHPLSTLAATHAVAARLAPSLQLPGAAKMSLVGFPSPFLATVDGLASPILSFPSSSAFSSPRGDRNVTPCESTSTRARASDANGSTASDDGTGTNAKVEDTTPTRVDNFTPDAFLTLCNGATPNAATSDGKHAGGSHPNHAASHTEESEEAGATTITPILSPRAGSSELWSEDDIEFLQTLLLG